MGLFGAFVCCQPSKCNLILFVFIVIIKQFFFRISICTRLLFRAFFTYNRIKFHSIYRYEIFSPKKPCSQTIRCTLCIKLAFSKHSWHIVVHARAAESTNEGRHKHKPSLFLHCKFHSIFTLADSFPRCPKILDSLNSTTTCAMLSTIFK